MPGFPHRPSLSAFGPRAVDTRPVRDASRELSAEHWNLMRHQIAGLGGLAPRAMLGFVAAVADPIAVVERAEAWNPSASRSGAFADPEIARVDVGRYVVTYPSPVPDESGALAALGFRWGFGVATTLDLDEPRTVQVVMLSTASNAVGVLVRDGSDALVDGDSIAVFIG